MANARVDSIEHLLREVWNQRGTDLLLTAGAPPLVRVDGQLQPLEDRVSLDPEQVDAMVRQTLPPALVKRLEVEREVDFAFTFEDVARFRGSAFHQRGSMALTLRLIPL